MTHRSAGNWSRSRKGYSGNTGQKNKYMIKTGIIIGCLFLCFYPSVKTRFAGRNICLNKRKILALLPRLWYSISIYEKLVKWDMVRKMGMESVAEELEKNLEVKG